MFPPASLLWALSGPQGVPSFLLWATWVAALWLGAPSPQQPSCATQAEGRAVHPQALTLHHSCWSWAKTFFLQCLCSLRGPGCQDLKV